MNSDALWELFWQTGSPELYVLARAAESRAERETR